MEEVSTVKEIICMQDPTAISTDDKLCFERNIFLGRGNALNTHVLVRCP